MPSAIESRPRPRLSLHTLASVLAKGPCIAALVAVFVACGAGFSIRDATIGANQKLLDGRGWYTPEEARALLDPLSEGHRKLYAITELTLDVVFPLVYAGLFLAFIHRLFPVARKLRLIPFVALGADLAENAVVAYLAWPSSRADWSLAWTGTAFTLTKWCAVYVAGLVIADGLIRRVTREPDAAGDRNEDIRELSEVVEREREYISLRRRHSGNRDDPRNTLIGLALSGGGIRSATTCFGVLQALSRMRMLPLVDYVCTVSGGGYIGSCLTSLLSLPKDASSPGDPYFSTEWELFPFNPTFREGRAQTDHLRTHGGFLVTRTGLLARETMRSIGHLVSGALYHLLIAFLALLIAALAYMGGILELSPELHQTLSDDTPHPYVKQDPAYRAAAPLPSERDVYRYATLLERVEHKGRLVRDAAWNAVSTDYGRVAAAGAALFGVVLSTTALWYLTYTSYKYKKRDRDARRGRVEDSADAFHTLDGTPLGKAVLGESVQDARERALLRRAGGYGLAATLVLFVVAWWNCPTYAGVLWLFIPALGLLVTWMTSVAFYVVVFPHAERFEREWLELWNRTGRSLWGAFQAMAAYAFWTSLLLAVFPLATYAAREAWDTVGLSGVASLIGARVLTSRKASSGRWGLPETVRHWLLALAIAAGVFLVLIAITASLVPGDPGLTAVPAAMTSFRSSAVLAAIAFLFLGWLVDANRVSLHYFYQDRLGETYLYTQRRERDGSLSKARNSMQMRLTDLHGPKAAAGDATRAGTSPYHLISAAINLAGSRDLTRKDRKSGYFLFSKYFCGSIHTGFLPTELYERGTTRLARAMTISGAAVSSGMGASTFFAQAFATVLFNLRLGYWVSNPSRAKALESGDRWHFWPRWLAREMLMRTNERSALVNLSDGGHTGDNVGIYPLLQRRCRLIIAVDAEQDGNVTFGSLTEALRHAYIDLGIEVDIDFTMIRPDPATGMSRSHCAVGLIRYPPPSRFTRQDELPFMRQESAGDHELIGYLVYLKNSLTGDEPEPVLNYKSDHPAFPHESTVDQFFDDAQFESYRALGVHITEKSLGPWLMDAEIFEPFRARYWPFGPSEPPTGAAHHG